MITDGTPSLVLEAIRHAETLLPGIPTEDEDGPDPRWQAIIAVGEFIESEPETIWPFIERWGSSADEDLQDAIATCLLEHLLEYNFATYFPKVKSLAVANPFFGRTFCVCAKFGQTTEPKNSKRFTQLKQQLKLS